MIWVAWRQQRTETVIAAALLVLFAALLLPTGLHMASAFDHDRLSACLGRDRPPSCGNAVDAFTERFHQIGSFIAWFTLVPGVIGVLLAAPFVGQFEDGTYRLDWTQSITRRRWIAAKLGLAVGAAVLASLAFVLLVTWWRSPLVRLEGRMDNSVFDSEGIVVIGYTLFALGLALAVGALWRRAVPAIVVAFGGYFAARLFVDTWLRQRLLAPLTATWRTDGKDPAGLFHAWVLNEYPSDRLGHPVRLVPGHCLNVPKGAKPVDPGCLFRPATYLHAVYEPATRFWTLQGIETAIFGGVAIGLIAFAAWWSNRQSG